MRKQYFRAGSEQEEKFLQECQEKGLDFYKLLETESPKRIYQILREREFKFFPSQPTLYRWKSKLKYEQLNKEKAKEKVSKVEQVVESNKNLEFIKEVDAIEFLKQVIRQAIENISTVTVLDGIKAAEMLIKYGEADTPDKIIKALNEALGEENDKQG